MAQNKKQMITIKALEQIFERLCDEDPRIRMFRIADVWQQNTVTNEFPLVMFELRDSGIDLVDRGGKRNTYTIRISALDQRLQDWSNVTDVLSNTHILLNDLFLRFTGERAIQNLGIVFDNKTYPISPALWKNNDIFIGNYIDISFSAPSLICLDDLPTTPLGTINTSCYSCGSGSGEHALTCATLVDCPVIIDIYEQIAAISGATGVHTYVQDGINTYTGGTPSLPTVNVVPNPVFTSVSASTLWASSTIYQSGRTLDNTYLNINAPVTVVGGNIIFTGTVQFNSVTVTGDTLIEGSLNLAGENVFVSDTVFYGNGAGGSTWFTNSNFIFSGSNTNLLVQNGAGFNVLSTAGRVAFDNPLTSFVSINASQNITGATYYSGNTLLTTSLTNLFNSAYAPISVVSTYVQNGTNTTTGGTISRPTVNLNPNISVTSVSAVTIFSGSTDLSHLLGGGGAAPTYVQQGSNITTGGTASAPIISVVGSPVFTAITANTIYSGGTDLSHLLGGGGASTFVQQGLNITTGGTSSNPIVNLAGSISLTAVTATTITEGGTTLENKYAPKDLSVTLNSSTYILQLTDDSRLVDLSGATAQNCVVPRNSAVAFPIGSQIMVAQTGVGQVSFSADTGVTILSYNAYLKLAGQYAAASLVKKDTNTWLIAGNTTI